MERHMIRILNHLHGILPSPAVRVRAHPVEMFNGPFERLTDGEQAVSHQEGVDRLVNSLVGAEDPVDTIHISLRSTQMNRLQIGIYAFLSF
jgi:hypothetical protein